MNREQSVIFLIIILILSSLLQIVLKISNNYRSSFKNKITFYLLLLFVYSVFFIFSFLNLYAYKNVSLSQVIIIESLSYFFVPLFSVLFLKERVKSKQWFGIIIIVLGIILYGSK